MIILLLTYNSQLLTTLPNFLELEAGWTVNIRNDDDEKGAQLAV